jgi:hypothetical protein
MLFQIILILSMMAAGLAFLLSLLPKINLTEAMGLSFPIGSFIITFLWFVLNWLMNVPISESLAILTIILSFLFLLINIYVIKSKKNFFNLPSFKKHSKFFYICLILITLFMFETVVSNIVNPIHDWDALTLYDFRAKVVTHSQSLSEDSINRPYFLGYPFYTTLGHVSAYIFGSQNAKLWYSFIYISLVIIFYGIIRRNFDENVSIFGALIIATNSVIFGHSHIAYTNLPYTLFYGFSLLYFFLWLERSRWEDLFIFSLLLAGSSWVRFGEPLHLVVGVGLLLSIVFLKRSWWSLLSFAPVIFMRKIWELYKSELLESSAISTTQSIYSRGSLLIEVLESNFNFSKTIEVLNYFYSSVVKNYSGLFLIVLFIFFLNIKNKKRVDLFKHLILIGHLLFLYLGTFYYSLKIDYWKSISGSLTRMSMIMIPAIYYLIFSGLKKIKKKES